MRTRALILVAVAALALAGCGDHRLVLTVDVLSYLDESQTNVQIGALPAGELPAPVPIVDDHTINLISGLSEVAEVRSVTLVLGGELTAASGSGSGRLRLYLSGEDTARVTARVDGRPTPVLKVDYLLRAVQVPAGRHQVVFRFESPAVRRGLLVSLISLVVVLAGFAASWWMRRRGPAAGGQVQRPVTGEEAA